MRKFHHAGNLAAALVTLVITMVPPLQAAGPPDATLYTSYFFDSSYQEVSWVVCGSTAQTEGCYDAGQLGPFGTVGAMLEGLPSVNNKTNTVTRHIYVVDVAAGDGKGVVLYVYKKQDVVSSSFDTTTITLSTTVNLPLTGGSKALCSMAANNGFLFIGTNHSSQAVEVQKSNLNVETIGGFSPPVNVTSITADKYGYVTVTFGGFLTGESAFVQFGPDGQGEGDGGGAWFMLSTTSGLSTATLTRSGPVQSSSQPARQLGYTWTTKSEQQPAAK